MPPNDGNTLGSANVRITADTTDLNAKVDQAKAKVAEIGPAANNAKTDADALFASMVAEGNKAADATENVTKKVGGLSAGLSTLASVGATVALAAVYALVTAWKAAEEAADKARESFRKAYEQSEKSRNAALDSLGDMADPTTAMEREIAAAIKIADKALIDQTEQLRLAGSESIETYNAILVRVAELEEAKEKAVAAIRQRYADKAAKIALDKAAKEAEDKEELLERFIIGQQKQEKYEESLRQKEIDHAEKLIEIERKRGQLRLRNLLEEDRTLERMYARQAAGFNGEGSNNSLQGSIDALEIAVRGAAARMGGL